MELKICMSTCSTCDVCSVTISDKSKYLSEDSTNTSKNQFKFSDTVSIDILQLNKISETSYPSYTINSHISDGYTTLSISEDGYYDVIHIVIPTVEWFNKELAKTTGSALGLYNIVYFADCSTIYKYVDNKISKVSIEELVEINTTDTTISKTSKEFVSICLLKKCYINLCQQIFDSRSFSSCWNNNKIDSELVYKRDLLWMALNVIDYLTQCNQLQEAERIIEILTSCNGICSSNNTTKTSGCGCSK